MPELPGTAELLNKLAGFLRPGRVEHSLNVAAKAAALARIHAPGLVQTAETAGIVHDNAKQMSNSELLAAAQELKLEVNAIEEANPPLLHGRVGAALLHNRFGIEDDQVNTAVADHVTGCPGMDTLSLILYVADQASIDRSFQGVEKVREAAENDLRAAAWLVARHKLMWTAQRARPLHPLTAEVYNELLPYAPPLVDPEEAA